MLCCAKPRIFSITETALRGLVNRRSSQSQLLSPAIDLHCVYSCGTWVVLWNIGNSLSLFFLNVQQPCFFHIFLFLIHFGFIYFHIMWNMCFAYIYVCAQRVCLVSVKARRGHRIPMKRSSKWLELEGAGNWTTSALKCWAISPVLVYILKNKKKFFFLPLVLARLNLKEKANLYSTWICQFVFLQPSI